MRLLLTVLIAVVASLTLHHGSMAAQFAPTQHHEHANTEHIDHDPAGLQDHHILPACCGMGLCLSGLPLQNPVSLLAWDEVNPAPPVGRVVARWTSERLYRPPRDS